MRIDSQDSSAVTLQQTRRAQAKHLQNVFSEVLLDVGRQGFASAEIVESTEPLSARIQSAWESWDRTIQAGRYVGSEASPNPTADFGTVLTQAYETGGYVDPKAFLNTLSQHQLSSVQHTHRLAEPIQVDSLSEEGALNLLIPPPAQVDLNRDGLTQTGAAYGIRFPDSTTPSDVAAAWDEATRDMPPKERMVYELQMKLPVLLANIELDTDGRFVRQREPGDPDFVNPMAAADYSFAKVAQDWIDHLNYFERQIDPQRYAQAMQFWSSFQQLLN